MMSVKISCIPILLGLLIYSENAQHFIAGCPERCTCFDRRATCYKIENAIDKFPTDIESIHFHNSIFKVLNNKNFETFPEGLKELLYVNSTIDIIEECALTRFQKLQTLVITLSSMKSINPGALQGMTTEDTSYFKISASTLNRIRSYAFYSLSAVRVEILDNVIGDIQILGFANMNMYAKIRIVNNKIGLMEANPFGLQRVAELQFSCNTIHHLQGMFLPMQVASVAPYRCLTEDDECCQKISEYKADNFITCDCIMYWRVRWDSHCIANYMDRLLCWVGKDVTGLHLKKLSEFLLPLDRYAPCGRNGNVPIGMCGGESIRFSPEPAYCTPIEKGVLHRFGILQNRGFSDISRSSHWFTVSLSPIIVILLY